MKSSSRRKRSSTKSVLSLPDLELAKAAVLNSLSSADAKRGYRHAIDEFVDWYCSEPRLAFNRIVVLRYRSHLESRQPARPIKNMLCHLPLIRIVRAWSPSIAKRRSDTDAANMTKKYAANAAPAMKFGIPCVKRNRDAIASNERMTPSTANPARKKELTDI